MPKHILHTLSACLAILVMASVAGTATGLTPSFQASQEEEYEMACQPLPMPPGWTSPDAGDPEAEPVPPDQVCIRDIQLESYLDGYQRLAIWIDMPRERLEELASVQYYVGDEFEEPYVIPDWVSRHERYIQFFFVPSEFDLEAFVTLNDGTRIVIEQDLEFAEREEVNPADHYFLAHLLVKENRSEEAIGLLNEYPEEVAAFQPAMTLLGLAYLKLGQQENALDALRNATEIDPGAAAAWGMLARVIIEDLPSPTPEELEEAHEAAQIAVDIRADPEYLDALGWAHHRVEQDEEALAILLDAKEAIMLVGKDHSTWEAIHRSVW